MSEVLRTEHLRLVYSQGTPFEKEAVNDISFSVNNGELIAIIGHTGSGKSSLIQMLNGLICPTSGTVYVDGEDIWNKKTDIRSVRFKVGLCFQYPEYQLFEETVYEDIAYGPKNKGLSGKELEDAVYKSAKLAGLTRDHLSKSPFELSGGEKRRAAIAGIMAMEPKILVLDEPTAGLDPRGRQNVLDGINTYRQTTGATVILVTHNMEDAAAYADRLLVLNKGRIEFFDAPHRVFEHPSRLEEIGLGIPEISHIVELLRNNGYAVPQGIFSIDAVKNALLPYLK